MVKWGELGRTARWVLRKVVFSDTERCLTTGEAAGREGVVIRVLQRDEGGLSLVIRMCRS